MNNWPDFLFKLIRRFPGLPITSSPAGSVLAAVLALPWLSSGAGRINQEGRILGPLPVVINATLFNSTEADAILSAMQIFPVTNAWNEDVSRRPVLVNSDAMIAQITVDLATNRRTLRVFQEMNFVLIPDSQPPVPITFVYAPEESDPSPYPIPSSMPIETWPTGTGNLTLLQWQQDLMGTGGDRHAIIVQPGNGFIWEMWQAKLVSSAWQASNGARFDLKNNSLRPDGWTSADAAGLPMFPALPRYDECERGMVEHACRIVVKRTRREYIYPATHFASTTPATQTNVPAMGQRLRLKSAFAVPASWSKPEQAILLGLKKYGALVADNGNFFSISITPDNRWPAGAFDHLSTIGITNFEVIQTTGPNEGVRSPGGPRTAAGPDFNVPVGLVPALPGFVGFTGTPPVIQWTLYSGPAAVTFANPALTNTSVSFRAPGPYTLMLTADDGTHAVSRSVVSITVTQAISLGIIRDGANVSLAWNGGSPPYVLERSDTLEAGSWAPLITTNVPTALLPASGTSRFFRVRGN